MATIINLSDHVARKQAVNAESFPGFMAGAVAKIVPEILGRLAKEIGTDYIVNPNLGRRVISCGRQGTIVAEDDRYFTVVYPNADEHGPESKKLPVSCVQPYPRTVTHWAYDDPDQFKGGLEIIQKLKAEAEAAGVKRQAAADATARQWIKDQADAKALWQKLTPAWAKAAIVAEYREDKSDIQSDYWGSTSKKTVLLGFSKSARDSFKEMRRFAATYTPTQSLATGGPDAEHREKYSMGAGYYLKNGDHHATGWEVRKLPFYHGNLPSDVVDFSIVAG